DRFTPLALLAANALHIFKLLLDVANAAIDFAAVSLQLGFTGTARADAAAKLRHLNASSGKPGQHVFQLRQLYLKLAFTAAGMPGKDVQNKLGAVNHARVDFMLNIALLGRREFVVHQN